MKKKEAAPKPRKKTVAKRAPRAKKAAPTRPAAPRIDYPQEAERIISSGYTVRIDAPQDGLSAEISIDEGAWQPCRSAVGFWWFDWYGFGPGEHVIKVRVVSLEGLSNESPSRRCLVEI